MFVYWYVFIIYLYINYEIGFIKWSKNLMYIVSYYVYLSKGREDEEMEKNCN